jgi:anti-anti-sigma regulatory factor
MSHCSCNWINDNTIEISGIIDESALLNDLFKGKVGDIYVNFENVKRINSSGIRQWAKALQNLDKKSKIIYQNCPPSIVENFSMVPEFLGSRSKVESFYAEYSCSHCKNSETILLNVENDFSYLTQHTAEITDGPAKKCSNCQSDLTFEHNPESFLFFLTKAHKKSA